MIRHVIMWKFKEDEQENMRKFLSGLQALDGVIPEILRMEMFLDKVQDAEMRQILRYRYEDGMTHAEVGEKMGYSRETIQKKEWRFWNEQGNADG